MFIIKLLSQHVSGIIMPISSNTRSCSPDDGQNDDRKHVEIEV